jgi:hypothetical protein
MTDYKKNTKILLLLWAVSFLFVSFISSMYLINNPQHVPSCETVTFNTYNIAITLIVCVYFIPLLRRIAILAKQAHMNKVYIITQAFKIHHYIWLILNVFELLKNAI